MADTGTATESPVAMETKESSGILGDLDQLTKKYPDHCKVIPNVGDFVYIVSVTPMEGQDLSVKFQIEESYPSTSPNVIIKSEKLQGTDKFQLMSELAAMPTASLCESVRFVTDWVASRGLKLDVDTPEVKSSPRSHKQKKKKRPTEETIDQKAPPMKTADDVIGRILWDESLPNECFTVGYVDRFLGVVEKPFLAFTWEDLASLDYDVLAIPKHRIEYFKYKGEIIWDKKKKLDNMFGSLGSGRTITDVMELVNKQQQHSSAKKESREEDNESDDEDDDVEIDMGTEVKLNPREKYWGPKVRPTHFMALRITNPDIKAKVSTIRDHMLEQEPQYQPCMIPVERLHMTLCCLGLDTEEDVQKAAQVIEELQPKLLQLNTPAITVHYTGLDQFFNNTLYARVETNAVLLDFVNQLKEMIVEAGVEIRDVFDFVPHMTIVKLSMQLGREMHTRYLDPRVFEKFRDCDFGSQNLDNIQLCSMSEDRQADGFYESPTVINISSP